MKYVVNYKTEYDLFEADFMGVILVGLFFLGILFLVPPVLGVISFVGCFFGREEDFFTLNNLYPGWTCAGDGGGMSAAPIYMALMGFVGGILIFLSLLLVVKGSKNQIDSIEKIENIVKHTEESDHSRYMPR